MGLPSKSIVPLLGIVILIMILIRVVYPAPFGPRSPNIFPFGIFTETWSRAVFSPKLLHTSSHFIIKSSIFFQACANIYGLRLSPSIFRLAPIFFFHACGNIPFRLPPMFPAVTVQGGVSSSISWPPVPARVRPVSPLLHCHLFP